MPNILKKITLGALGGILDQTQQSFGMPESNLLNRFRRLSVSGLDGSPSRSHSAHFGLPNNQWGEIDSIGDGLPWDMTFGFLTPQMVSDAKGDLEAMKAQLQQWTEYSKTQQQTLDTYEDVKAKQVGLAKATMQSRQVIAGQDLKASEALYNHNSAMAILGQQNANAADLAMLQQQLGIRLQNHQLGNDRQYANDEFSQATTLSDARYEQKSSSLVQRYRDRIDSVRNPVRRETDYMPTPGRVLRFPRSA
jgi:hypothetical protein